MGADEAAVGKLIGGTGRLDEEQRQGRAAFHTPHGAARQHDVIAGGDHQMPIIREQLALACMHEEEEVAVGIARQIGHAFREPPMGQREVRIAENLRRRPRIGGALGRPEL